ncbi:Serine/threonine-protein kinase PrkC [Aquicella siphonis]|uniref:Serine/threonine-protein kinase PrkC n=1 Tax=Aquicella siphonis TaxID=254247 RepID=A0A5E4PFQ6_9COXI|nr:protein kinase [Aquicella siphonis]VVC75465.1 Serine/threonine-protein kinase PrkC [Aquicella siphonis]
MSKKNINLGIIDPSNLTDDLQNKVLSRFLENGKTVGLFSAYQTFHIKHNHGIYRFQLAYSILHRKRATKPGEDRYEIIDDGGQIGAGAIGKVMRIVGTLAPDDSGRLVFNNKIRRVVKIQAINKSNTLELILNEAMYTQRTNHMHMKDPVILADRVLNVMHFLPGELLVDVMAADLDGTAPLTLKQRLDWSIELLRMLQEQVHNHGIIHRDVKPENILICKDSNLIHIFDFGLSKFKYERNIHEAVGSPLYAPREQVRNKFTDEKSDVYTMGKTIAILWRLLADSIGVQDIQQIFKLADKDTNFDKTDFHNLPGLNSRMRKSIFRVITHMTLARRERRISVEAALKAFEEIRLQFRLSQMHAQHIRGFDKSLSRSHKAGLAARKLYAKMLQDDAPLQDIYNMICGHLSKLSNDECAIREFTDTLAVRSLYCMRTKEEIVDTLGRIMYEFEYNKQRLFELSGRISVLIKSGVLVQKKLDELNGRVCHVLGKASKLSGGFDAFSLFCIKMNDAYYQYLAAFNIIQFETGYPVGNSCGPASSSSSGPVPMIPPLSCSSTFFSNAFCEKLDSNPPSTAGQANSVSRISGMTANPDSPPISINPDASHAAPSHSSSDMLVGRMSAH